MGTTATNNHDGHRQRLLKKIGEENLLEHELVEMLLFYVFKRRNTNDLAHRLLAKFGNIHRILSASMEELQSVEGIGKQAAQFLWLLGRCQKERAQESKVEEGLIMDKYDASVFVEYVRGEYDRLTEEVLDFYLLDWRGDISFRRRFQGNRLSVWVDPSVITQMLLDNSPSGIIAVHNHPSGSIKPSQKDDEMTRICQLICSSLNVMFCDHVIVAKGGMYSYYSAGEMQRISKKYSVQRLAEEEGKKQEKYLDEVCQNFPKVFKKDFSKLTFERQGDGYIGIIKE